MEELRQENAVGDKVLSYHSCAHKETRFNAYPGHIERILESGSITQLSMRIYLCIMMSCKLQMAKFVKLWDGECENGHIQLFFMIAIPEMQ